MKYNIRGLRSTCNWGTPDDLYKKLDQEFAFNDDPCPEGGIFGFERAWGSSSFVNPPYSEIPEWLGRAVEESRLGKTVVLLLPSRTDSAWFHDIVLPLATEIRFIRGRLRYKKNGVSGTAPFPSLVVVFKNLWDPSRT
jgi:site-specific DNA-methyltransferase (adenine-specific)